MKPAPNIPKPMCQRCKRWTANTTVTVTGRIYMQGTTSLDHKAFQICRYCRTSLKAWKDNP